jgi:nuclear transport factor 2 (NTF2) superfamily protein
MAAMMTAFRLGFDWTLVLVTAAAEIETPLRRKRGAEHDYRLIKELWCCGRRREPARRYLRTADTIV